MAKNFKPLLPTIFIFLTAGSIANAYPAVLACAVADIEVTLSPGHLSEPALATE